MAWEVGAPWFHPIQHFSKSVTRVWLCSRIALLLPGKYTFSQLPWAPYLFSLVDWSGQQKEGVVAPSQSGIRAAVRTVLCQLLFLHNRFSDSKRNWGNRGVFQWLISLLGTRMSDCSVKEIKKKKKEGERLRIVFCWMPTGEKVRFSKLLRNQNTK